MAWSLINSLKNPKVYYERLFECIKEVAIAYTRGDIDEVASEVFERMAWKLKKNEYDKPTHDSLENLANVRLSESQDSSEVVNQPHKSITLICTSNFIL